MSQQCVEIAARIEAPRTGLVVEVIDDEPGFTALRAGWNALVDEMDPPSPFNSWEWAHAWWTHLRPEPRGSSRCLLRILTFREGGRLVGLAPFYTRPVGYRRLGATVFLPLGWEPGKGWSVTEQLEFLFPEHRRGRLIAALSDWFGETRFSVAALPGLRDTDALSPWIREHTVARGTKTEYLYRGVGATWDEFTRSLNKSLRDNVKYYPNLLRRAGHTMAFTSAGSPHEVIEYLPMLFDLHRARARAPMRVLHQDYFAQPQRRAFFRSVCPALAALGRLRIGVLWLDATPVAAQMWLENLDTLFLYYSGYEPAWSRFSVGLIATVESLRSSMIERGVRRIEFLAGGGQFKERWDPERRFRYNLTLAAHPAVFRSVLALSSIRGFMRRFS
jgi:CelD/BcsL family acetyltransferase involved in cellulose biosynthesis